MNVSEERDKNRCCVDLRATDAGYKILERYRQFMALDAETPTIEIVFGRLLMYMGQYEKAARYFVSLGTRLNPSQMIERVAILSNQANCYYHMCKYQEAHSFLEEAFTLLQEIQVSPSDTLYLRCQFYLGNVYLYTNQLGQARNIFEQILEKQRSTLSENQVYLVDTLRAMGKLHGNESGYRQG